MFAGYTVFLPAVKLNRWLMKRWKGSFRAKDGRQTLVENQVSEVFWSRMSFRLTDNSNSC